MSSVASPCWLTPPTTLSIMYYTLSQGTQCKCNRTNQPKHAPFCSGPAPSPRLSCIHIYNSTWECSFRRLVLQRQVSSPTDSDRRSERLQQLAKARLKARGTYQLELKRDHSEIEYLDRGPEHIVRLPGSPSAFPHQSSMIEPTTPSKRPSRAFF
jgi:hypothetical protein